MELPAGSPDPVAGRRCTVDGGAAAGGARGAAAGDNPGGVPPAQDPAVPAAGGPIFGEAGRGRPFDRGGPRAGA